ncbi:MAG TPA: molybdopterin-dependent oxidoreductase, partial [Planctomycetota bacterium]|nr:molybdopterin-dependent oxidoreductase [Planctomycetota bacterium]
MTRVAKTVCSHDCPDACGVVVEIEDRGGTERAIAFHGDPEHPFTRGFLCGKVHGYADIVHSPERLLHPLRRVGPKGSGRFERTSWDEALSLAAERFLAARDRHGGESLLLYYYAGTMGIVNRFSGDAVFHRLGATRQRANICHHGADEGYRVVLGEGYGVDPEDSIHSDLIIVWGSNVVTTNVHLVPFLDEARRRGARMIVIDPYRNR